MENITKILVECYQHLFSSYYITYSAFAPGMSVVGLPKTKRGREEVNSTLFYSNISTYICPTGPINFDKYYQLNSKTYGKSKQPSPEFLNWLIGFSEGDGSFITASRGDLYFVITQDTRDKQVLEFIQKELNMGKVITQGKTTSRFIIQDKLGLYLISLIFNGNIRTPDKLKSFNKILNNLNTNINKPSKKIKEFGLSMDIFEIINPYDKTKPITLNDNWLTGFVDAEGCFHASLIKNRKNSFRILFDLNQKGIDNKKIVLEQLSLLFGVGKIYKHYQANNWYYRVSGLSNTKVILDYFDKSKYTFLTKKFTSYLIWKQIHTSLSKLEHLDPVIKQKLVSLCKTVNKYSELK